MDEPYTRPDEDPFSTQSVLQERAYRHLAYPDLPRPRADSSSSYVLVDDDDIPLSTSPRSFLSFFTPKKNRHSRSASASSVHCSTPTPKRPSALSSDTLPLPRPSFSSSTSSLRPYSYLPAMSTTTFDTDISLTDTPTKSFFDSLRYPTHSLSNITDVEDSNIDNYDFLPPPSNRFSRASSHSSASLPSSTKHDRDKVYFSSSTRGKKKKKLLISGIGASEFRKFEGVKRWCEVRLLPFC
jgi:hypothetical protein